MKFLAILLCSGGLASLQAGSFQFTYVNYPNDTFTQLLGINNSGTIAGYHNANTFSGFTATLPSNFTTENFPGSAQTQVVGINTAGNTDGFFIDNGGVNHGFTDVGGTFTVVDSPNTSFNQLLGINDKGQEAGYSSTDPAGMVNQNAYTYNNSSKTFTYLTNLLPAGTGNSQATGINNSGEVSGFYVDAGGVNHGFLDMGGSLTTFNAPVAGESGTQILGVNNLGEFVGDYTDAAGNTHGFFDENGVFQTLDAPLGIGTTTINGVNDLGQLVGFFVDGNGNTEGFVASPVPEPSTSLLLTGVGVLGFALRRRLR